MGRAAVSGQKKGAARGPGLAGNAAPSRLNLLNADRQALFPAGRFLRYSTHVLHPGTAGERLALLEGVSSSDAGYELTAARDRRMTACPALRQKMCVRRPALAIASNFRHIGRIMSAQAPIPFVKMNGLGNDFVVIDARAGAIQLSPAQISRICDRTNGIGCDQLIMLEPGDGADLFMRIFNADSSQVSACGNASRCIADLIFAENGSEQAVIETRAGRLRAWREADGRISVDMGRPRFDWQDMPLSEEFRDTRAIELQIGPIDAPVLHSPSVVNVGNPHAIFWVEDLDAHDLARFGPLLENHPLFPERANISLAQITAPDAMRLKVWERGAGLTRACGTAACAAVVCAARRKLTERRVEVTLPGGMLTVEWRESDQRIVMTGPVETEFAGEIGAELLDEDAA
jgi:diaminopimelate epimerase